MQRILLFLPLLLPLGSCTSAEAPPAGQTRAGDGGESEVAWWHDVTEELGLDFVHETGAAGDLHLPEIMGSGAAWLDVDVDGDLDAYLINGNLDPARDRPAPETPGGPVNRLYRQGADGRFADATDASGLGDSGYGMGVAVGDVDNDGAPDVYLANFGPDRLYRNRGDGTFEDVTEDAGIAVDGWSSSAVMSDFDADGDLDLYVARYVAYDPAVSCQDRAGRREYCGPTAFPGVPDVLLQNDGHGHFRDVSERAGITSVAHAGLGVVAGDFDGDGDGDFYVANDADPNELWLNDGTGRFEERGVLMGAAVNARGQTEAGMGVLTADLDEDLRHDLFVTHLADESNTLYLQRSDGTGFEDRTVESGLDRASLPLTGFGTAAFDADLDSRLDLVVVNGRVVRGRVWEGVVPPAPWDAYAEPNLFFIGRDGARFDNAPTAGGDLASAIEVGRGLAAGDMDGDGDIDLLVSNGHGRARIYRNEAPRHGRWLSVEPFDQRLGRVAVGALVTVDDGRRRWVRFADGGGSYMSATEPVAHFGLGDATRVDVTVRWPDGRTESFPGIETDRAVRLVRGAGEPQ